MPRQTGGNCVILCKMACLPSWPGGSLLDCQCRREGLGLRGESVSDQMADGGLIDITNIDLQQLLDADDPDLQSALDQVLAQQPEDAHNRFNSKI